MFKAEPPQGAKHRKNCCISSVHRGFGFTLVNPALPRVQKFTLLLFQQAKAPADTRKKRKALVDAIQLASCDCPTRVPQPAVQTEELTCAAAASLRNVGAALSHCAGRSHRAAEVITALSGFVYFPLLATI